MPGNATRLNTLFDKPLFYNVHFDGVGKSFDFVWAELFYCRKYFVGIEDMDLAALADIIKPLPELLTGPDMNESVDLV